MKLNHQHILYLVLSAIALILLLLVIIYAQIVWFKYQNGESTNNNLVTEPATEVDVKTDSADSDKVELSYEEKLEILNNSATNATTSDPSIDDKMEIVESNTANATTNEVEMSDAEKRRLLNN